MPDTLAAPVAVAAAPGAAAAAPGAAAAAPAEEKKEEKKEKQTVSIKLVKFDAKDKIKVMSRLGVSCFRLLRKFVVCLILV